MRYYSPTYIIIVNSIFLLPKKYLKIHLTLIFLCLSISYIISSFAPTIIKDNFIVKFFYKPTKSIEVKLDKDGIPWAHYFMKDDGKAVGFQRNPVTTVAQANEFYDLYKVNNNESSKTYFLNNVNWLVNNAISKENYSLLQYNFPIPILQYKQTYGFLLWLMDKPFKF